MVLEDGEPRGRASPEAGGDPREPTDSEAFRDLFENAPIAYFSADREGWIRRVNRRAGDLLGDEPSRLVGRSVLDLYADTPDGRPKAETLGRWQEEGANLTDEELQIRRADGEIRWVSLTVHVVRDEAGRAVERRGALVDITDRKRAEEALRESEERFHRIFEHSNDAIFLMDPEADRIVEANSKAAEMLEYGHEELLGLPVSAVHPDEMPELMRLARGVFEEGSGWTDELTCLTKSGSRLPAEVSASWLEMTGERYLIASVRDVSDRRRAEEALRKAHHELEQRVRQRTHELRETNERLKEEIEQRREAEEELRRSEQTQRMLLELTNAGVTHLDRDALWRATAEALAEVVPLDRASVALWDRERDVLRVAGMVDRRDGAHQSLGEGTEFLREESDLDDVLTSRKPEIRGDLMGTARSETERRLEAQGIRSYISLPLVGKRGVLGALNVGSREPRAYSQRDVEFLMAAGHQIGLVVESMLAYEEVEELRNQLELENIYLKEELQEAGAFGEMIGRSPAIREIEGQIEQVAPTDATVLIVGESGTGKELVAREVHARSARADGPLITVNCAAIPSHLHESEFFGHVKGAFSGAVSDRQGRFAAAHGGTLFLDEVAELPLEVQGKLLRALQEGTYQRVGENRTQTADVRIVAASNRDLDVEKKEGRFREDLYYRLNVFPIRVPPLRERSEDIAALAQHFLQQLGGRRRPDGGELRLTEADLARLESYHWPGNVRELQNVMERAVITADRGRLGLDLPEAESSPPLPAVGGGVGVAGAEGRDGAPSVVPEEEVERWRRENIQAALERADGKIYGEDGAAALLGVPPTTLASRIKKLGIER